MRTQKRHSSCNNMNTELMDLPIEILINILLRLLINSLHRILCVSKAFLNTVDDLSFLSTDCTSNVPHETPQFVLLIESSEGRGNITHPLTYLGDNNTMREIKDANTSGVWSRLPYFTSLIFCNLFFFRGKIREVLMLPAANNTGLICQCDSYGMGLDRITNNFEIVRISQHTNEKPPWNKMVKMVSVAAVLVLGTNSWREINSVLPPCLRFSNETSAYGDTHWLVLRPNKYSTIGVESDVPSILSFNFKKEEFCWTPHPTLEKRVGGSLALVDCSSDSHMEIWGLKSYDKKEWVLNYKIDMKHPFWNLHVWLGARRLRNILNGNSSHEHFMCRHVVNGSTVYFFQDTCHDHTSRSLFLLDLTCISNELCKTQR
ncbi:unnamed protein product [Malus baccata var. baccata]